MNLIESALLLAFTRGLPVFPLKENKRPCHSGGFKNATTDPEEIRRAFADPLAHGIGVPCGPASGFDALDIDVKRDGMLWLQDNEHRLPVGERHRTPSGGWHILLRHIPGQRTRFDAVAPGVEIRGEGGYIRWYEPATNPGVTPEWPDWLILAVERGRKRPGSGAVDPADLAPPDAESLLALLRAMPNPATVDRGQYVAVNLAVQGAARALESLDRLNGTDPDDIKDAAAEWSARWEGPTAGAFDWERRRWDEDWATRENDVSGWRHLLGLAARFGLDVAPWSAATAALEFGAAPEPSVPPDRLAGPHQVDTVQNSIPAGPALDVASLNNAVTGPTESEVAAGFARLYAGRLIYCHTAARWHIYNGSSWREDETDAGRHAVLEYLGSVRALFGGDAKFGSASTWRSVEALSRSFPALSAHNGVWDRDPWLLGVPGGVVDLRTGQVSPGRPDLYIRRQAAVAPDFGPPESWLRFLDFALRGDADLIAFLQRWTGYGLTGDVSEEALLFFYGDGGNGKGVFLGTQAAMMGDYAYTAPAELGEANSKVNPEYQRANLPGRRLVFMRETKSGAVLDERQVKELTGNEGKINARHPAGRPFEFVSQAKISMVSNHEPRIRGRSEAMERRLRVVPFDRKPPEPDKRLKERLIAELPRILGWAIQGCLAWQQHGLGTCDAVRRASAAYFEDQDVFGRWAAERVEHGADLAAKRTDLLADYASWARSNGEPGMTATEFYETARRRLGAADRTVRGVRFMGGVSLRREEPGNGAPVAAADLSAFRESLN